MFRLYLRYIAMPFCAAPKNTLEWLLQPSGDQWSGRSALQALTPGFPRDEPPETPAPRTQPPIPTDVPIPSPTDVPVPEPRDVPPPDPGKIPNPAKPRPTEVDPKPRSVP